MESIIVSPPRAAEAPLSIDEWISGGTSHSAKFEKTQLSADKAVGVTTCTLTCNFKGSFVYCQSIADTTGDAFLKAIEKIEGTIGREWRQRAS